MGGLFSRPKISAPPPQPAVEIPPPPEPLSPPATTDVTGAGDAERRRLRRKRGRKETFITGDLTPEPTGKKAFLG